MNKRVRKIKSIINYLATIFGWALFIILLLVAVCLVYYFINVKIYNQKGQGYEPKFSIYTIVSPSMTPLIKVYDVIINTKINSPEEIKEGDIITFISTSTVTADMTITHRVIDIDYNNETNEYEYTTKGDNNQSPDSAPALYSNVIGKAKVKLPQLGRIQFFVSSKFGWLLVVIIPALWVIIGDIIKLVKINKIKKKAEVYNNSVRTKVESQNINYGMPNTYNIPPNMNSYNQNNINNNNINNRI